eukprot:3537109-Alexandrium_andersonii.AAC.1
MSASLVGSEMCIRDSPKRPLWSPIQVRRGGASASVAATAFHGDDDTVSYTHLTLPTICSV